MIIHGTATIITFITVNDMCLEVVQATATSLWTAERANKNGEVTKVQSY